MDEYATAQTRKARMHAKKVSRECLDRLAPIIGAEAALEFHVSVEACIDIRDRLIRLAAVSGQSGIDPAHTAMLQELECDGKAALAAFDAAQSAMHARLAVAARRDDNDNGTRH
jgi:hypothetical protein